jgi:glycosyltransferase involved in cell wall biosynthesis
MKILIITPTLGESPWLDATVASVAALSFAHEHVLVAPTGVVAELARSYPGATIIPEAGGGMYAAINTGLAQTQNWDAFTYINDDDLLLPAFAQAVTALALQAGRPCFVYGRVRLINRAGRCVGSIPVSPWPALNRSLYAQRLEPVYQHGTLVSRAAWAEHGGFDENFRLCGDSEYFARLCVRGVPAVRVRHEVAAFRLHPEQLTKNRMMMNAERARVDAKLHLLTEQRAWRHHWAKVVFRASNLPAYLGRIWRYGPISFDQLLERGG